MATNLEKLLETNKAEQLATLKTVAPSGWERGQERVGDRGRGSTGPMEPGENADQHTLLKRAGFDPDEWSIVGDVHYREWDANVGGGVIKTMQYRKFDVRRNERTEHGFEELMERVKARAFTPTPGVGAGTFNMANGDWQLGKALKDDTPVLTPSGWVSHGDIRPGDYVFGPDGKPREVLGVTGSTEQDLYEVQFDRGVSVTASGDHVWEGVRGKGEGKRVKLTTRDLMNLPKSSNRGREWVTNPLHVQLTEPVEAPLAELPIEPHLLGLWLGDGASSSGIITKGRVDSELLLQYGHEVRNGSGDAVTVRVEGLTTKLRTMGVLGNKHIPEQYLMASAEQRLRLLQGLMDTDGSCSPEGVAEFSNTNPRIIEGVRFLLSSLGFKLTVKEYEARIGDKSSGAAWRIQFSTRPDLPVFTLQRKLERGRSDLGQRQVRMRQVRRVVPAGRGMAQCLTVEGGLYLAGRDLVVTHNCDGDGTEGIVDRILQSTERAVAQFKQLRKGRTAFVHIPFMGDCGEGFVSQGGKNIWRTELTQTEQNQLTRRLMDHIITEFAPLSERVTVTSVPGNHDEAVREPGMTTYDDSFAVDSLVAVTDAMLKNPAAYGHVETIVPRRDELTVTMDVNGTIICHAHGHQWRPGKHWDWWQGQSFEPGADIGKATVLLSAHGHHFSLDTKGQRQYIMSPAQESMSRWWQNRTGDHGAPGALTFVTEAGRANLYSVL